MPLEAELIEGFVRSHPKEAARTLAGLRPDAVASVLVGLGAEARKKLLACMPPLTVAVTLRGQDHERIAAMLQPLPSSTCGPILRAMGDAQCDAVLGAMSPKERARIEPQLRFPEGTIGALMDPAFLAVSVGTSIGRAVEQIRDAETAAIPFVAIVDEGRLIGIVELEQLVRGDPDDPVETLDVSEPRALSARASGETALANPDWLNHPSLPVTDAKGRMVGVLRYAAMRRIERRLIDEAQGEGGARAAAALAELYGVGLRGMASFFASVVSEPLARGESK